MEPIRTLWRTLTSPHPSFSDAQQRRTKLLLEMLLFIICTAVLSLIAQFLFVKDIQPALVAGQLVGIALFVGVYVLSRTHYVRWATFLFIAAFNLFTLVGVLAAPPLSTFTAVFLVIPVILTWILGSPRQSVTVALVNLLIIVALLFFVPAPSPGMAFGLVVFYLTTSLLILLFIQHAYHQEIQNNIKLEASENRFYTFIQEADDWVFSLDENGRIVNANRKACQALGLAEADVLGKRPMDFVKPEDQNRVDVILHKLFQSKSIDSFEIEVPVPNGRNIWLEVRGRILTENNKIVGTIHIARDITESKRAYQAQQKLNWQTTLLYEASKYLSQSLNFNQIYDTIYHIIIFVLDCPLLVIYTYQPEKHTLRVAHIRQDGVPIDPKHSPKQTVNLDQQDERSQALIDGQIHLLEAEAATSALTALTDLPIIGETTSPFAKETPPIQAAFLLPLKFENQVRFLIQVFTPQIPEFSVEDRRFWEAFSQQTAVALTNARLLAKNQREIQERRQAEIEAYHRQAEAETLRQAAAILNSSLSLNVVLTRILEQLRLAIPYDSASVQQKEGNQLIIRAAQGFADDAALLNCGFAITADLPNAHAMRALKPLALENVRAAFPSFNLMAPDYQAEHVMSWLGVPLVVGEAVLGMITVDRNEIRPFSEDEITMAVTFANHASIALRNAHLYQEMEHQTIRLEQAVAARTAELQRTTDQVEAIFNNSPDVILLLNTNYEVERVNSAIETLFGYRADEVLGAPPFALATNESHGRFVQAFQTAVATGKPQRLELTARRKDQSLFDVTVALAPIYEHETVTAVVCSLHDISAFKEIDRLKDEFVSNVSHELRTPIANLKLHHDLIKLNPQKQAIYLERQEREIDRLTIIIESLLRLSRLDQRHVEVNPTAVNLLSLAQQFMQDRAAQAEILGLTLHLTENPTLPQAKADRRLLDQVIGVILTNAITYTPSGGAISISGLIRQKLGKQWVGLRIQDTGPGIAPEEQEHVFNRFYRGQAGRASGVPGTGLGLAIAHEIIILHQGEIELTSPGKGQGTTFTIWLPAMV